MKSLLKALALAAASTAPLFAQEDPCSYTTPLTGGTTVKITNEEQKKGQVPGTSYYYELWHNPDESQNEVSIKYYGADQGGGAAFRGEFNEPNTKFDYLARIGYDLDNDKKLYTDYEPIYADYSYTRSARLDGDNYSYIGVYGWARSNSGNGTPLVEYYIVDDWWGNRHQGDNIPVGSSTICNGCNQEGANVTIDGGIYKIYKNTRTGYSMEGNKEFDQYFSVRQTTRKCGTISVSEHFRAWDDRGLKLGTLYEAKILAEAGAYGVYAGATVTSGWIDYRYAAMRIGGAALPPPDPSACITLPASPPADPYNTCFKHTDGNCYVCSTRNEEGGYTCSDDWVWDGNNVDDNLEKGFWYDKVDCPAITPILNSQFSILNSKPPIYYSIHGKPLGNVKPSKSGVYIVKEGYSVKKIVVK